MTKERQDITDSFYSGNKKTIHVIVYDEVGALKDLTGSELTYVMFHRANNTPVYISKSSSAGDSEIKIISTGVCDIYLNSSDTVNLVGTFRHHLNIVDGDGAEETVFSGKVEIHYTPATRHRNVSIKSYLEGITGV